MDAPMRHPVDVEPQQWRRRLGVVFCDDAHGLSPVWCALGESNPVIRPL
jgi:hypothetical protein